LACGQPAPPARPLRLEDAPPLPPRLCSLVNPGLWLSSLSMPWACIGPTMRKLDRQQARAQPPKRGPGSTTTVTSYSCHFAPTLIIRICVFSVTTTYLAVQGLLISELSPAHAGLSPGQAQATLPPLNPGDSDRTKGQKMSRVEVGQHRSPTSACKYLMTTTRWGTKEVNLESAGGLI